MDANAIQIAGESLTSPYLVSSSDDLDKVRPRQWHTEKELPFLAQSSTQAYFLGDGSLGVSPRKATGGCLREVVGESHSLNFGRVVELSLSINAEVVDNRQLNFDSPEPGSESKRGQPGAKRYKDRR